MTSENARMQTGARAGSIVALLIAISLAGCLGDGDSAPGQTDTDAGPSQEGSTRIIDVDIVAMQCPAGYDNQQADNICIAYNGQIPGPTWVFAVGDHVKIQLQNRVAQTLEMLGADAQAVERLADARYSLHRHGISQDVCSDGVAQPVGTQVCDSTVGPGESITYTFDTVFPGFWHYHDHSKTFSVAAATGTAPNGEGVQRGLWGSFIVLPPGKTTQQVFDLHLNDAGANSGLGLDGEAQAGERFDVNVVGLGFHHRFFDVRLTDPDGAVVGEVKVGPGVSRGITVQKAQPGIYTWTAEGITISSPHALVPNTPETLTGTITVTQGDVGEPVQPPSEDPIPALPAVPPEADRVIVIPFNHLDATARGEVTGSMGLPLVEVTVGEVIEFRVVGSDAVPHVFHLHGHSWEDPNTGTVIDAIPLIPGQQITHTFTVVAGLDGGHTGDWFYHCHIGYDSGNAAMWGILRVLPQGPELQGTG